MLNSETGDDLLQQTGMTADDYAITVTLFSLAYGEYSLSLVEMGRILRFSDAFVEVISTDNLQQRYSKCPATMS